MKSIFQIIASVVVTIGVIFGGAVVAQQQGIIANCGAQDLGCKIISNVGGTPTDVFEIDGATGETLLTENIRITKTATPRLLLEQEANDFNTGGVRWRRYTDSSPSALTDAAQINALRQGGDVTGLELKVGSASSVLTTAMTIDSTSQVNIPATLALTGGSGNINMSSLGGGYTVTFQQCNNAACSVGNTAGLSVSTNGSADIAMQAGSGGVELLTGNGSWSSISDIRHKEVIGEIEDPLEKILTLSPIMYRYKTDAKTVSRVGLVAQEVLEVLPEAVNVTDNKEKTLLLKMVEVLPLVIGAMQEQQAIINDLKARIEALEN